jgi:hypothetical protein
MFPPPNSTAPHKVGFVFPSAGLCTCACARAQEVSFFSLVASKQHLRLLSHRQYLERIAQQVRAPQQSTTSTNSNNSSSGGGAAEKEPIKSGALTVVVEDGMMAAAETPTAGLALMRSLDPSLAASGAAAPSLALHRLHPHDAPLAHVTYPSIDFTRVALRLARNGLLFADR